MTDVYDVVHCIHLDTEPIVVGVVHIYPTAATFTENPSGVESAIKSVSEPRAEYAFHCELRSFINRLQREVATTVLDVGKFNGTEFGRLQLRPQAKP